MVNERGQAHDVKNLFIVDGSIFVTAGGVNPTSTIQALALYVADGIKTNVATLFDARMTEPPTALDDLAFMDALLDLVIPPNASGSLPGAGTLGLSLAVRTGLQADPMLGPMVGAGVQAIREAALAQHPRRPAGNDAGRGREAACRPRSRRTRSS